jgi:hypothetical protein
LFIGPSEGVYAAGQSGEFARDKRVKY